MIGSQASSGCQLMSRSSGSPRLIRRSCREPFPWPWPRCWNSVPRLLGRGFRATRSATGAWLAFDEIRKIQRHKTLMRRADNQASEGYELGNLKARHMTGKYLPGAQQDPRLRKWSAGAQMELTTW